jgi:hypothetical protein
MMRLRLIHCQRREQPAGNVDDRRDASFPPGPMLERRPISELGHRVEHGSVRAGALASPLTGLLP